MLMIQAFGQKLNGKFILFISIKYALLAISYFLDLNFSPVEDFEVVVGERYRNTPNSYTRVIAFGSYIEHPNYDDYTLEADICKQCYLYMYINV